MIESTTSRASITVSIRAARTIRWIRLCWLETFTNSVRSSSRVGSRESTPTIASISANDSSACASRASPVAGEPGDQDPAALRTLGDDLDAVAHPSQTDFRRETISWRFSWIRARTSWATDWTSALSSAGSAPIRVVSIGSRKRILNFAGR